MATRIAPVGEVAGKWQRRASSAGEEYRVGVSRGDVDWEGPASGAQASWFQGVTAANGRGAFASGVRAAGNDKWRRKSTSLGADRYGPGVTVAQGDYESGFAPFREAIANITPPPRGARGSPGNLARVAAYANALAALRTRR